MIDEADKAPLEVVAILKGLIEDGQLLLADGRRCASVLFTGLVIPIFHVYLHSPSLYCSQSVLFVYRFQIDLLID
jgi:hypothetical protein